MAGTSASGCSEEEHSSRKDIPNDRAGPCVLALSLRPRSACESGSSQFSSVQFRMRTTGRTILLKTRHKVVVGRRMTSLVKSWNQPVEGELVQRTWRCIHSKKVWTVMQRDDAHRRRWKIIWKEGVQRQCGRRIVCCGRLSGGLRRLVSDAATVGPEDKDR